MAITLPPDYYLDNFRYLIDFVAERYWPLLSREEQCYYRRLSDVSRAGCMLYVRLLSRRGELFRRTRLRYGEIGDIDAAARALAAQQLLHIQPGVPFEELLPLFTMTELARVPVQALPRKLTRPQLEQCLLAEFADGQEATQRLLTGETLLQLQDKPLFDTFKLCFFGNLRQDLTDFVLRDLGLQQYERYPLDRDHLPFSSRARIDRHLQFYRCAERLEETLQGDATAIVGLYQELPEPDSEDPVLTRRLERFGNTLARQLERLESTQAALQIYQDIRRPPARERRTRILIKQGDIEGGMALCRQIAAEPANEEERVFAEQFGYRQGKKHGIPWPEPGRYQPPAERVQLPCSDHGVEQAVATHLATHGPCYYVENALLNGVLGLLIWDIVFAPVRGAFFNPFQFAPADFHDPGFFERRRAALEQRLQLCDDAAALSARVLATYAAKHGLANPLVNWSILSEALLQLAIERIPASHWQAMLRRLLGDLRYNRNGLPDLLTFPDEGSYQWVEVKGPGDRLQKNQLRWLAFFADHDIPHRVVYVDWLKQHGTTEAVS